MDNLTSNLIGRHVFKDNIKDEVQHDLIDIYGGALNSISVITNELIKESGKMTHLMKDKRAVLFEPREKVTGILICDYNSIDLRRKLKKATDLFCKIYKELINDAVKCKRGISRICDVSPIVSIF